MFYCKNSINLLCNAVGGMQDGTKNAEHKAGLNSETLLLD